MRLLKKNLQSFNNCHSLIISLVGILSICGSFSVPVLHRHISTEIQSLAISEEFIGVSTEAPVQLNWFSVSWTLFDLFLHRFLEV